MYLLFSFELKSECWGRVDKYLQFSRGGQNSAQRETRLFPVTTLLDSFPVQFLASGNSTLESISFLNNWNVGKRLPFILNHIIWWEFQVNGVMLTCVNFANLSAQDIIVCRLITSAHRHHKLRNVYFLGLNSCVIRRQIINKHINE